MLPAGKLIKLATILVSPTRLCGSKTMRYISQTIPEQQLETTLSERQSTVKLFVHEKNFSQAYMLAENLIKQGVCELHNVNS